MLVSAADPSVTTWTVSETSAPPANARRGGLERELGLELVARGYVGGFEPSILLPRSTDHGHPVLAKGIVALNVALHSRMRVLRRLNSRRMSGYVMGVYRTAAR